MVNLLKIKLEKYKVIIIYWVVKNNNPIFKKF